jgi:hypothetical protein
MQLKKVFEKLKVFWIPFFVSTIPIILLVRIRFLRDMGYGWLFKTHDFNLLFFSIIEDIFSIGLISLITFLCFTSRLATLLCLLLVAFNSIAVIFYGMYGTALTFELIDQIGDLFTLIGSTDSTTNKLILYLFFFAVLYWVLFVLTHKVRGKIRFLFPYLCLIIIFFGGMILFDNKKNIKISYNSIFRGATNTAIFKHLNPKEIKNILGHSPEIIPRVKTLKASHANQKNIVVIVLETGDYDQLISQERKFSEVMPFFYQLSKSQHVSFFREHLTTWPFSSKSLYSISCGIPPVLDSFIDLRFLYDVGCMGWMSQLSQNGYELGVFYSGDLRYDNMGKFFKTQGADSLWDRYMAKPDYEKFALGVDDEATYKAFLEWAPLKKPFASLIIPINSHIPFWTPAKKNIQKFKDLYENAFAYQDILLKFFFSGLKEKNLLKNTVIFITADHGRQYVNSRNPLDVLSDKVLKKGFHVPLLVYDESKNRNLQITYPTSHMDISGSILESSGVEGNYLKNHNLKSKKPIFSFFKGLDFIIQVNDKDGNVALLDLYEKKPYFKQKSDKKLKNYCDFKGCEEIRQALTNYYWLSTTMRRK